MSDDICRAVECGEQRKLPSPFCAFHLEKWREEKHAKKEEEERKLLEEEESIANIIVTTGDIREEYEIIGPVYFSLNNSGIFTTQYHKLVQKYIDKLNSLKEVKQINKPKLFSWSFLYGEYSFGMGSDFDQAFFISVEELKKRAVKIGGDGIINMRQDIDLDTNGFQRFYLQIYGTAIKLKKEKYK